MTQSIIAIGLDSADPVLLEKWMEQGHLKNLKRLCDEGAYGRVRNMEYYKGESAWTNFMTGCLPNKTGYWSKFKFDPKTYKPERIGDHGAYSYDEFDPFYSVGDKYRVAVFDMPQTTLAKRVNGLQVLAWGAHAPMIQQQSQPTGLLDELIENYGEHPADAINHQDRSDWYNTKSVNTLIDHMFEGLERRTAITCDLIRREPWNLFLTAIGETHTAGHYFWHLSQPEHPLYKIAADPNRDPLLEFYEATDKALGEMIDAAPDDAHIMVFAAHGMGENSTDLLSMVMLPEFLYRFSFPGKCLLPPGEFHAEMPPIHPPNNYENWYRQIPTLKQDPPSVRFRKNLLKPFNPILPGRLKHYAAKLLGVSEPPLSYHPTSWYHPYWRKMKAFALPGFSDGYIRLNVKGRESSGVVAPEDYDKVCDEIIAELHQLKDARTGRPVVKGVERIRKDPMDSNPKLPDADLAVMWDDYAVDTIEHPKYGRIGPLFFNRSSGHRGRGFVTIKGPGIEPGSSIKEGHAVDLGPTILELMGAPIPSYMDGKPLLSAKVLA